jgi:predicted kinase
MLIFINGAFGVGKTTVAELLVSRLPNSLLYDPEEVGGALSRIVRPIVAFDDFQDLPPWRPLLVTTARLLKESYGRTLVMPMTIWRRDYFDEVMTGLRQFEAELFHFCLTATKETLQQRLYQRESSPQALAWTLQRVERCVTAFASPAFAVHLATDNRTPDELAKTILDRVV